MNITVQLEENGPITVMDDKELVKTEGNFEDEKEKTNWTEYRLKSDPAAPRAVHRSVNMFLKKPMVWGFGEVAELGK